MDIQEKLAPVITASKKRLVNATSFVEAKAFKLPRVLQAKTPFEVNNLGRKGVITLIFAIYSMRTGKLASIIMKDRQLNKYGRPFFFVHAVAGIIMFAFAAHETWMRFRFDEKDLPNN